MKRAPKIGQHVIIKGIPYRRMPSPHLVSVPGGVDGYPRLCDSLHHSQMKGCKIHTDPRTGRKKAIVNSRRHERDVMARNDLVRGGTTFDTD